MWNRQKNHFCQLLHVYQVNDSGWTEVTAELLVLKPSVSEVEKATERCMSYRVFKEWQKGLPKIALKWMPKQKRARGRPKKNWTEGIKKAMNKRNLNEGQWEDRKQ